MESGSTLRAGVWLDGVWSWAYEVYLEEERRRWRSVAVKAIIIIIYYYGGNNNKRLDTVS
jgi:hypothetical protein